MTVAELSTSTQFRASFVLADFFLATVTQAASAANGLFGAGRLSTPFAMTTVTVTLAVFGGKVGTASVIVALLTRVGIGD